MTQSNMTQSQKIQNSGFLPPNKHVTPIKQGSGGQPAAPANAANRGNNFTNSTGRKATPPNRNSNSASPNRYSSTNSNTQNTIKAQ